MRSFTENEGFALYQYLDEFREWFKENMIKSIQPLPLVAELRDIKRSIGELQRQLNAKRSFSNMSVEIGDELMPLLKCMLMVVRRLRAVKRDDLRAAASHTEAVKILDRPVHELDAYIEKDWFQQTESLILPSLTEFVVLSVLEEKRVSGDQPARRYEDKFRVLQTSSLFLDDLRYFRAQCELRGVPLVVAFIDIDNFKKFNTKYTEEVVDRDLLPRFASVLEAHVYNHGYGYQQGGDEYLVLLPNMSEDWGGRFLREFQRRLEKAEYRAIPERPTVSIGLCHVTNDCFLTDREIRERANWAKNHAKEEGRNCIAVCSAPLYRKENMRLHSE